MTRTRLAVEELGPRVVPAALLSFTNHHPSEPPAVLVTVDRGVLTITGTDADDFVRVEAYRTGGYLVTTRTGTGEVQTQVVTDPTVEGIRFVASAGNDTFINDTGLKSLTDARIQGGAGLNVLRGWRGTNAQAEAVSPADSPDTTGELRHADG
jgi:hypothetical protein